MNGKEEQLMNELVHLFELQDRVSRAFDAELYEHLDNSEVRCIACVGYRQEVNGIQIANELKMTRGAITKITHKLISKGYLSSYQKMSNRKEVYFALTATGQILYAKYMKSYQMWREKNLVYLHTVLSEHQQIVYEFLQDLNLYLSNQIETNENRK